MAAFPEPFGVRCLLTLQQQNGYNRTATGEDYYACSKYGKSLSFT